jgi:hypothetical protein
MLEGPGSALKKVGLFGVGTPLLWWVGAFVVPFEPLP